MSSNTNKWVQPTKSKLNKIPKAKIQFFSFISSMIYQLDTSTISSAISEISPVSPRKNNNSTSNSEPYNLEPFHLPISTIITYWGIFLNWSHLWIKIRSLPKKINFASVFILIHLLIGNLFEIQVYTSEVDHYKFSFSNSSYFFFKAWDLPLENFKEHFLIIWWSINSTHSESICRQEHGSSKVLQNLRQFQSHSRTSQLHLFRPKDANFLYKITSMSWFFLHSNLRLYS